MQLFWASYRWTGDKKYLTPIVASVDRANKADSFSVGGARIVAEKDNIRPLNNLNEDLVDVLGMQNTWGAMAVRKASGGDDGKIERKSSGEAAGSLELYVAWEMTGDKKYLEDLYGAELKRQGTSMYSQTEGHWWVDRVEVDSQYLQRTRMGGIALTRGNITPGNTVSWRFADPNGAVGVAILVPSPARDHFKVIAYNVTGKPIRATMTGWNVAAGQWEMKSGVAKGKGDTLGPKAARKSIAFEKTASVEVVFAPKQTTMLEFTLKTPGPAVETRPDLGIGADDVKVNGGTIEVTVHSLGAVDAPAGTAELLDAKGKVVAQTATPPLPAPVDLQPHTAIVRLAPPARFKAKGASVRVAIKGVKEITLLNNSVTLH
jgi:hypothetical protein